MATTANSPNRFIKTPTRTELPVRAILKGFCGEVETARRPIIG
jgi:hypothetical protein